MLISADLNGDGKVDVITRDALGMAVLLGNGDGSFQPPIAITPTEGQGFVGLAAGDFNSDGRIDLALAGAENTGTNIVSVFLQASVILSATQLTFPTPQLIGTFSPAKTITVTNVGNSELIVTSVAFSGIQASDFTQTNNCVGLKIPIGGACTVSVVFAPISTSLCCSASLVLTDNGTGGTQTISVSGKATPIRLAPSSIGFGSVVIGQTKGPANITVTNLGGTNWLFGRAGITGAGFTQTDNCIELSPGQSCTIQVTFSPATGGRSGGWVSFPDSPRTRLEGTGIED
jgi:hypothetical protein